MNIEEMIKLIEAVSANGLTSFCYEEGEQKLVLKKENKVVQVAAAPVMAEMPMVAAPMAPAFAAPAQAGTAAGTVPAQAADTSVDIGSDNVVTSPLVGTFYSSASPESEPFVKVGDTVKKGQVLGIIEAMKLMNEIESEFDGVVEAILIENEGVVEFGQPLFRIK